MIEETIVPTRVVLSSVEACVTTTLSEPIPDQKDVEQSHEQHAHPNASTKNPNRLTCKPSKGDIDLGLKIKGQVG
jgi:hypothetical protein